MWEFVYLEILTYLNFNFRSENQNLQIGDEKCLSLKQDSTSLEDRANYKLFEGVKSFEHAQISKHHEKSESTITELEIIQKDKPKAKRREDLHLRQDVVNKTLLRAVKRFYSIKFKSFQKSMVNERLTNAKTSDMLDVLDKFWQQQLQDSKFKINYRQMAEFMMLFLDIKPQSTYKFDNSILAKAEQALDCIKRYSSQKFRKIQQIRELRILIIHIHSYDIDEFFSRSKTMEINFSRYISAIEEFIVTK